MATITLTATGLTPVTKTISTGDTIRLLNAHRKVYGQLITQPFVPAVPAILDSQGNVITPAVAAIQEVKRDYTDQEIFNKLALAWFDGMKSLTYSAELTAAITTADATATAATTQIAFT